MAVHYKCRARPNAVLCDRRTVSYVTGSGNRALGGEKLLSFPSAQGPWFLVLAQKRPTGHWAGSGTRVTAVYVHGNLRANGCFDKVDVRNGVRFQTCRT